jgi:hypothetical protein
MPRGGARVGAGRKKELGVVLNMDGQRRPAAESAMPAALDATTTPTATAAAASSSSSAAELPPGALELPPSDLRADAKKVWLRYAPFAVQQGTLIPSTVGGFRQFCKAMALAETLLKAIHRKGPGTSDAESSLRLYIRLDQRVDAMMGRFKLTAFGKPADSSFAGARSPAAATNPWARVAGK